MSKTHFEIIEVGNTQLTVDVSMIADDQLWFNATEVAKSFGKMPKDWLKNQETQDYIDALSREENSPIENYVKVKKGGKYQGTWLHASLRIPFARWCSPIFAVKLDKWVVERFSQEQSKQSARLEAKTGYLPMSQAVVEAHDHVQFYHFSTEANLLNSIVLGMSAKKFKEIHGVDSVRDNLSASQLQWIDKLQRINTGLIEIGMSYKVRKAMLEDHYNDKMRLAA